MRYFKHERGGSFWMWDSKNMWHTSSYKSPWELRETFSADLIETDAAGNPLGKYRYFRDTGHPKCEWRHSESAPSWEIRNFAIRGDWISSSFYTPSGFLSGKGAYECDQRGNRLEEKKETGATNCGPMYNPLPNQSEPKPEPPAPMSEEDRFRWQFAGQAMIALMQVDCGAPLWNGPLTKETFSHEANMAVAAYDAIVAELKKTKATENGGGR